MAYRNTHNIVPPSVPLREITKRLWPARPRTHASGTSTSFLPSTSRKDLPPELLCKIFAQMVDIEVVDNLPPWRLYREQKGWLEASATCHNWRKAAIEDVNLWRRIDVGETGSVLPIALQYSKQATVDITFHDPEVIPNYMTNLLANAHRIRKLIVVALVGDTVDSLVPLLSRTPMPALTELWINTMPHHNGGQYVPRLHPRLLPALHTVEVTHLRFDWRSPIIPCLRSLYLGPSPEVEEMDFDVFLRALQSCNRLEFLKIDRSFPVSDGGQRSRLTVSLPNLRRIFLETEHPPEVHGLLSHMRLSAHTKLDVRVRIDLENPTDNLASAGLLSVIPQDASCIPILHTAVDATLKDRDLFCYGPDGVGMLSVEFEECWKSELWRYTAVDAAMHFTKLFARAPLTDLCICPAGSNMPSPVVACVFRMFPSITSLTYGGVNHLQTDLAGLLTPDMQTAQDGSIVVPGQTFLLPNLRSLYCASTPWMVEFLPRLMEALRRRYIVGRCLESLEVEFQGRDLRQDMNAYHDMVVGEIQKLVRGDVQMYDVET